MAVAKPEFPLASNFGHIKEVGACRYLRGSSVFVATCYIDGSGVSGSLSLRHLRDAHRGGIQVEHLEKGHSGVLGFLEGEKPLASGCWV